MGLRNSKPYSLLPPQEISPISSIFDIKTLLPGIGLRNSKPYSLLSPQQINPKSVIFLSEDIIENILYKLPVKWLLKFRCVSKSWRSLIDSKRFISIQYRKNSSAHEKVVYDYFDSDHPDVSSGLKQGSIMALSHSDLLPFDDPINNHLMTGRVAGICDGLLCILKQGRFFLWNPATRISVELPKIDNVIIHKYGLGWDERSDAYKVFAVVSDQNQRIGIVYSSKTNSWKTVEHGCCPVLYDRAGLFSGGKIYWVMESGDKIEWFDLESEEFGRINLPCKLENGFDVVLVTGGCGCRRGCLYCVFHSLTSINEWVMLQGSWVRIRTVSLENKSQGQGVTTVTTTSSTTEGDTHAVEEKTDSYQPYVYAESLVSPLATLT